MKNLKRFFTSCAAAFTALIVSACSPSTPLSEQYFEQPTISESNVVTVELHHKDESKWLDVLKQKATTVGLRVMEYNSTSKDPKNTMDVYLRRTDVYNDAGEVKSKVQEEIDEYDLQYLISDYYTKDIEETPVEPTARREEEEPVASSEPEQPIPSEETTSQEPEISEEPTESSSEEEAAVKDPYFPIAYGTKDSLAAKFSFDIKKFIDKVDFGGANLFSFRVAMQKYDTKTAFLGSETFVLGYADDVVSYALPVEFSFGGKVTSGYVVSGHAVKFVEKYFSVITDMSAVEAKFEVTYKNENNESFSEEIDLENTKFVDVEGTAAEGEFNVSGKHDIVVQLKQKAAE